MGLVIDELFAFIAIDEDGDEGIIAAEIGDTVMPLVAADLARVQKFIPIANVARDQNGIDYRLKHFKLLGDVSDEYLEQFKSIPEPSKEDDDPGDNGAHEQPPNGSRGGNGSTPGST